MTTFLRTHAEHLLIGRRGSMMVKIGLDGTTIDGTNAALVDPITYAIRKVEGFVANPVLVDDVDMATIPEDMWDAFLDVAELRLMRNMRGNSTFVDITAGPLSESLSQLANQLARDISNMENFIEAEYGLGGATLEADVIRLNFAEQE